MTTWQMQTVRDADVIGGSRTEFTLVGDDGTSIAVLSAWETDDCECGSSSTVVISADTRSGDYVRLYLNDDQLFDAKIAVS